MKRRQRPHLLSDARSKNTTKLSGWWKSVSQSITQVPIENDWLEDLVSGNMTVDIDPIPSLSSSSNVAENAAVSTLSYVATAAEGSSSTAITLASILQCIEKKVNCE
eukprot:Seg509.13 transcript_id=Seg509.13/GoldUCD/mRNA.D3Y31 product="hypothetical protein" protein_id=Seg509.13/GoldUCD/D3Y31